jgi:hypothetical protein
MAYQTPFAIHARTVARAMIAASCEARAGVEIAEHREIVEPANMLSGS